MKKYITLILIIYSTGVGAQDWIYTPFATSTPYPTKMKILKIGTVDMSLPENECPAKNWSFYTGDNNIPWFEYKTVRYNKGMMVTWIVAGWTMQELKAIEDSANGITYSFQIETWYDTVKPKSIPVIITTSPPTEDSIIVTYGKVSKGAYKPDTAKPKLKTFYNSDGVLKRDTVYTPVPLYYEVKKGRTIFSMKKTKHSKSVSDYPRLTGIQGDPPLLKAGTFIYEPGLSLQYQLSFNPTELMDKSISYFLKSQDTLKPQVFYGTAGIKQAEPKDTLKKYYFHRYIFFMDRMNETTGKKSARFEDSATYYYKKLYKK